MKAWVLWLIAMAVMLIIELLSGAVVALCLAAGCLGSALAAACGTPLWVQVVVAAVGSILALVFLGPSIKRLYSKRSSRAYASNMDALIGRTGRVTAPVTHHSDDNGRVQIDGDSWLAWTDDPSAPLYPGTQVTVLSYESLVLKVKPLKDR